jgi:hypothetical protein
MRSDTNSSLNLEQPTFLQPLRARNRPDCAQPFGASKRFDLHSLHAYTPTAIVADGGGNWIQNRIW